MTEDLQRPVNLDAERFILGCLLLEPSAIDAASALLLPDDFAIEANRRIYQCILHLHSEFKVDRVILADELMNRGWLESVGGLSYLISLDDGLPQIFNLDGYIQIVKDKAARWNLIQTAWHTMHAACDETQPIDDVRQNAEKRIVDLGAASYKSPVRRVGDIIAEIGLQNLIHPPAKAAGIIPYFESLAEILGTFRPGEMTIVAARPSWGKTALGLQLALEATSQAPVFFVSMEMNNSELIRRMLAQQSQTNAYHWPHADNFERERLSKAAAAIGAADFHICEKPRISASEISRALGQLNAKAEQPVGLVVVDYLQLMSAPGKDNRNNEIAVITRELKIAMQERNAHLLLLSQLSREAEKEQWALGKPPSNGTLRDSGAIEQDADNILYIWPDRDNMQAAQINPHITTIKTDLWVTKQRNGSSGRCSLEFVRHHTRFQEPQKEEDPQGALYA